MRLPDELSADQPHVDALLACLALTKVRKCPELRERPRLRWLLGAVIVAVAELSSEEAEDLCGKAAVAIKDDLDHRSRSPDIVEPLDL